MKLYIQLDYKNKEEICGSIFNLPKKKKQEAIYLRFNGIRMGYTTFELIVYRPAFDKQYVVMLDEIIECKMTGKDILFYIQQRIEHIWKMLKGDKR